MLEHLTKYYAENRETLVKQYSSRAGGEYNAEDVVQLGFERAVRYIHSAPTNPDELPLWMNTVISKALLHILADERKQGMSSGREDDELAQLHFIDVDLTSDVTLDEIEDLISKSKYHQQLRMILMQGHTIPYTSEFTGVPVRTIEDNLSKFRALLRNTYVNLGLHNFS